MASVDQKALDEFKLKAGPVSITVFECGGLAEALDYALAVSPPKDRLEPPCPVLGSVDGDTSPKHLLAAPGWSAEIIPLLKNMSESKGFQIVTENLRNYPSGFDLAFTSADLAIAATATCVLKCPGEDLRLATMLCETQVLVLPKSRVVREAGQAEDFLRESLAEEAMYAAFISGPSRTADIERVLTLGVHGSLAMHVILLGEEAAGMI